MKNLVKGVLLVILALPQVSFDCLSQDNETVSMNLDRLKERLGVRFVYDSELGKLLDKNYEGTSVEGLTLEKALGRLLDGTGVKWEICGGYVVLTRDVPAKKRYTVCGYVTDEATGETLIGAGVVVSVTEPVEVASAPVAFANSVASMVGEPCRTTSSATKSGSATGRNGNLATDRERGSATGRVGNTANTRENRSAVGATGTSINNFGFYSLTLPEGEVELTYSYIGCAARTKRINLKKNLTLNVALAPSAEIKSARITARKDAGIRSTYMGAVEVPNELIANTPVVLGEKDVLKTLQMMPGVQGGNEGFSGIYVRGGGADENLMLLDGTAIYNVSHLFGLLSVFTPEAVKKVTVYRLSLIHI